MGGLYDLLETYRIQNDPRFAYEGLYQDPMKPKNNVYDYYTYDPDASPYGGATMYNDIDNLQPFMSSSFPQEFGVGSLFNPRVGRPEQSIYYKEPEPADPTSLYSLPKLDTSRFTGVDLESGYLDRAGSYGQDVYAEQEKQKGSGIGGLFKFLLGLAVPGAGFLMNLPGRGLEGIRSLNQRLRNTTFGRSETLADYFQAKRDQKAREAAAARGAIKQQELARQTALQQMRSDDAYGGGGGGIGSSYGGSASPGSQGPGGSDEMGSF